MLGRHLTGRSYYWKLVDTIVALRVNWWQGDVNILTACHEFVAKTLLLIVKEHFFQVSLCRSRFLYLLWTFKSVQAIQRNRLSVDYVVCNYIVLLVTVIQQSVQICANLLFHTHRFSTCFFASPRSKANTRSLLDWRKCFYSYKHTSSNQRTSNTSSEFSLIATWSS